jgi:hypothetical protein
MLILYRKQVDETVHEIQSQSEEEKITQKVRNSEDEKNCC